ncbi:hypothetical protein MBH78_10330 [Oceanimonas sp. NS1]|nr:hypothetical protein [Oceanimonas sp. NS1]
MWAYANPSRNGDLTPLKEDVERIINGVVERGIQADDVSKAVTELRADLILGLDSAQGKARQLSLGQVLQEDPCMPSMPGASWRRPAPMKSAPPMSVICKTSPMRC